MDNLREIVRRLEQQKAAIDRALAALRESDASEGTSEQPSSQATRKRAPAKRRRGLTPEGRARLAESMRQRWALKRSGAATRKGRKRA